MHRHSFVLMNWADSWKADVWISQREISGWTKQTHTVHLLLHANWLADHRELWMNVCESDGLRKCQSSVKSLALCCVYIALLCKLCFDRFHVPKVQFRKPVWWLGPRQQWGGSSWQYVSVISAWSSGTSGWVEWLLSSGEGGRHPLSEDEEWQLRQSHGWRRQRRLWWKSQTFPQDAGTPGQLPKSHTAITDWDDHSTVRFRCLCPSFTMNLWPFLTQFFSCVDIRHKPYINNVK